MMFYDFECFKYNWLLCAVDTDREKTIKIWDDVDALQKLYDETKNDIYIGFNNRHYDKYIYQGILCGYNPYDISEYIITRGNDGWSFSNVLKRFPMLNYDVMSATDRGLKFFEASMGNDIRETEVPFDIDRPLTDEEKRKTEYYCMHDVEQTIEVFQEKYSDFSAQMDLMKMFNRPMQDINKSKVQLSAAILGASKKRFDDEFDIDFPHCLKLQKYDHIRQWYLNPENRDYSKKMNIDVAGAPHIFAWGGVHGAIPQYNGKGYYIMADVASLYPSLMIVYDLMSRAVPRSGVECFKNIYDTRLRLKHEGKKKEQAPLKIVLNGTYGAMKDKHNPLYDPRQANRVCVYGQMLLLMLIEWLEPYGQLIQSNTDGILFKMRDGGNPDEFFQKFDDVAYEWEKLTGLNLEFDEYSAVYQKDVNNYLIVAPDGKVKCKGAYLKEQSRLDYDLPIVNKALRAYMIDGTRPEHTINNCNELKEFQLMAKLSSKYTHAENARGEKLNEKTLRIFASTDPHDTILYKVSKRTGKPQKIANCPEHSRVYNDSVNGVKAPAWLDKKWYINMAYKRLSDFGIKK